MLVYRTDGSAQTIVRAATLRCQLQIKLSFSSSYNILTPSRPVQVPTLQHQAPGKVAAGVSLCQSLAQLDPSKAPRGERGSNPGLLFPRHTHSTVASDAQTTHAIIPTDSMNLLQKVESGMGCLDWHTAMDSLRLQRLLWICCPGHAGVSGNERADRLASTADITSGLQLGKAEVLKSLRNFLNMGRPEHHSTDRLKERGVEKGSGQLSTLRGRERQISALLREQPWGDC